MRSKTGCLWGAGLLSFCLFALSACLLSAPAAPESVGGAESTAAPTESVTPPSETGSAPAETETPRDDADYTQMQFPNYSLENPVRYAAEEMGRKYDGWQNFGLGGEIRTVPQPMGMTYTYQMYSWFIRNDLRLLYPEDQLPESAEALPEWIADTTADGRRTLFFSMGELPASIELCSVEAMTVGDSRIIKAKYRIAAESSPDLVRDWILYFLAEPQTCSVFAIRINEGADTVERLTDAMVQSYRLRN